MNPFLQLSPACSPGTHIYFTEYKQESDSILAHTLPFHKHEMLSVNMHMPWHAASVYTENIYSTPIDLTL